MEWVGWCVFSSIMFAAYLWINSHFRLPPRAIILGRSLVTIAIALPFLPFIEWPSDQRFYLWVLAAGLAGYYFDLKVYQGVTIFGSASISRLLPMRILLTFAIWAASTPDYVSYLFAESWRGIGVVSALLVAAIALSSLSRSSVSLQAIRFMLPGITALALTDIFSKYGIIYADRWAAIVLYPLLVSVVMVPLVLAKLVQQRELGSVAELWQKPGWAVASFVAGTVFALQIASKGVGLQLVPDPSYFVAISMLSALWLTLLARIRREPDHSNQAAGLVFVGAIMLLVLCAP
jgi:hypothetical protein